VEKKEEKREDIICGRFELLWTGRDHCNLNTILQGVKG